MNAHAPSSLIWTVVIVGVCSGSLLAQTSGDSSANKSSTSSTQPQYSGSANPTRSKESHTVGGNRTVDTQVLERIGADGKYEPYLTVEKEIIRIDSNTVKTVERSYARGSDGQRQLMQVTEAEARTSSGGDVKTVRTTSNPDVNGNLQVVQKLIEEKKQTSPQVQEIRTSRFAPDSDGALRESERTDERQTRTGNTVEFQKTDRIPDLNGNWQTREERKGTIKEDGAQRLKEESIQQPDSDGKMGIVQRTVEKQSADVGGQTKATTETYSVDLPGVPRDGSLHPVERVTTVHTAEPNGKQSTQVRVERPNPGSPNSGMQVTSQVLDVSTSDSNGVSRQTRTIQAAGADGNLGVVWVDMGVSDNPNQMQVSMAPQSKAAQTSPAKPASQSSPQPK